MAYQPLQTEQEYDDLQPPAYQPGPSGAPIPMQSYCQPQQQQSSVSLCTPEAKIIVSCTYNLSFFRMWL